MSWNRPEEVLREVAERFGEHRLALAASWQKESSVLVDLVQKVAPGARIFTLDTGALFEETYATWRAIEERYGIKVEAYRGEWIHGLWASDPDRCCFLRKVEPLERALADADCWISGVRRDQSASRADTEEIGWDDAARPVEGQPARDLERRRRVGSTSREHDLPYNVLHEQGYASIGCTHCTVREREPRGPLGRAGEDRVRTARLAPPGLPPPGAGGGGHPRHPGGGRRARAARAAVQRRQGLDRPRPPRPQGVPARAAALPAHARGHGAQLRRGDRLPRPLRGRPRRRARWSPPCRRRSTRGRVAEETRPARVAQPPADRDAAGRDRGARLRRGLRRRAPRRGARAGQGAHPLLPRRLRPVGPAPPAPRAVEPLQRARPPGRARARVPALQLDGARRVGVHRGRGARAAVDLLRPRARRVRPRRDALRALAVRDAESTARRRSPPPSATARWAT